METRELVEGDFVRRRHGDQSLGQILNIHWSHHDGNQRFRDPQELAKVRWETGEFSTPRLVDLVRASPDVHEYQTAARKAD